jgi:hypothetical protein
MSLKSTSTSATVSASSRRAGWCRTAEQCSRLRARCVNMRASAGTHTVVLPCRKRCFLAIAFKCSSCSGGSPETQPPAVAEAPGGLRERCQHDASDQIALPAHSRPLNPLGEYSLCLYFVYGGREASTLLRSVQPCAGTLTSDWTPDCHCTC